MEAPLILDQPAGHLSVTLRHGAALPVLPLGRHQSASTSTPTRFWPRWPTTCSTTATCTPPSGGRCRAACGPRTGARSRASASCWSASPGAGGRSSSATSCRAWRRTSPAASTRSSTRSGPGSTGAPIPHDGRPARHQQLDELPPDLAGRFRELQNYDFTDPEAQRRFEELSEELRQQLLQSQFNRLAQGMGDISPERMAAMKDMLAELNQMLAAREAGEEPDFAGFMARHGQFFPGNPQSLDELLEQMARSMAQMRALLNSMTPEQRRQLQELAEALMGDLDLSWQLDDLARHLQGAFPDLGWDPRYDFSGADPLDLAGAPGVLERLGDLDELEHLLRSATSPAQLAEADVDRARELLGDEAADSLDQLARLAKMLEEAGLIDHRDGRYELTPKGLRRIGQRALSELFSRLAKDRIGGHKVERAGIGHERANEHKPYEFGDPFALNVEETLRNALRRQGAGHARPPRPGRLRGRADGAAGPLGHRAHARPVAVDADAGQLPGRQEGGRGPPRPHHQPVPPGLPGHRGLLRGGPGAARPAQLPEVSWDFVYGTNMQHAFMLARRLLAHESGTRQIIMVTDGEPTAHIETGPTASSRSSTTRRSRRRSTRPWPRSTAAPARASASTPSCSTPPPGCAASSSG